MFIVSVASVNV